jgi:hypothetical protein
MSRSIDGSNRPTNKEHFARDMQETSDTETIDHEHFAQEISDTGTIDH